MTDQFLFWAQTIAGDENTSRDFSGQLSEINVVDAMNTQDDFYCFRQAGETNGQEVKACQLRASARPCRRLLTRL